jgi:hypothetical protein
MMKKEYIKPFTEVLDVYAEELMDSFHAASPLRGTIGAGDDEGDPEDNTGDLSGGNP